MSIVHKIKPGDPLHAGLTHQNFNVGLKQASSTVQTKTIVDGSIDTRHTSDSSSPSGPYPYRESSHHYTATQVTTGDYATSDVNWINIQFELYNGGAYYMVGTAIVHAVSSGVAHIKIISAGSQVGHDIITSVKAGEVVTIPIMWGDEWYDPSNATQLPGTLAIEIQNTATGSPGSSNVTFDQFAADVFVIHV